MMKVTLLPILNDNYAYILEVEDGSCAVVDPGEAEPIITYLDENSLSPVYILNTHHHGDHIAGNAALKNKYGAVVVGPEAERGRIKELDQGLQDGDVFSFHGHDAEIIACPGHTSGGISFYFKEDKVLFSGDTLFSMGCGRLFEGTPQQMFSSLERLAALPDDTLVYCGHEYTLSNAEFCLSVDAENAALRGRYDDVVRARENHQPTIPVSLGVEKQTNVFLRAKNADDFARLRLLKDDS